MSAVAGDPPVPGVDPAAPPAGPRRLRGPWYSRAYDTVSAYLPLLLMAVLALGTWWLVKNTPVFESGRVPAPLRHEPDYTMSEFTVQRFGPDGKLRAQIEGDTMRHYPDTETIEVDNPRVRSIAADGRVTMATARRALSNRDGSDIQLFGDAHVVREATAREPAIEFRGEFLDCARFTERVRSHLPVQVIQGQSELHADAMAYDNLVGVLDLRGHVRAVLTPTTPGSAR
jgi:lipopolysaccharide export system protein LptC